MGEGREVEFEHIAADELRFLVDEYGFQIIESDTRHVRFESSKLWVEVWFDPRGEVALIVQRIGTERAFGKVEYVGMLGTAPMPRVVHLLAQHLRENASALAADGRYFDALEADQRRASREWTDYYSRKRADQPAHARFE